MAAPAAPAADATTAPRSCCGGAAAAAAASPGTDFHCGQGEVAPLGHQQQQQRRLLAAPARVQGVRVQLGPQQLQAGLLFVDVQKGALLAPRGVWVGAGSHCCARAAAILVVRHVCHCCIGWCVGTARGLAEMSPYGLPTTASLCRGIHGVATGLPGWCCCCSLLPALWPSTCPPGAAAAATACCRPAAAGGGLCSRAAGAGLSALPPGPRALRCPGCSAGVGGQARQGGVWAGGAHSCQVGGAEGVDGGWLRSLWLRPPSPCAPGTPARGVRPAAQGPIPRLHAWPR